MNQGICLDPNSINFNINSLSGNGFAIYTDADNFTSPIAVNIPASLLFPTSTGNCQFSLSNIPAGANQILVVDQCDGLPPSTPGAPDTPSYTCCYALLTIPEGCVPWCEECGIGFDTFQTSSIGQIVAGNLTSSCGTVTDYTIGWYLDGDYSAPALTTGFGSAAGPYQFQHPLTGSGAIPALAGDWEGIIHDVIINGITYSSISGSANGTLIPFESCFGTIVIDPLTCDNGTASGKYSHQYNFNSQAVGTTPAPVSLTYTLDSTIKYFAYFLKGSSIWDELEIKWVSGDPNATSDPSLYSQPIYLEKIQVGTDTIPPSFQPLNTATHLGYAVTPTTTISNFNNVWPKAIDSLDNLGFFQRTLTLTNLETSSNPAAPDLLEITITPNPSNNNTQWQAGFQCLTDFDCTNCIFDDYPNSLNNKIHQFSLTKTYGCSSQQLTAFVTGCLPTILQSDSSDFIGSQPYQSGINSPSLNLVGSKINPVAFGQGINLGGQTFCTPNQYSDSPNWTSLITSPNPICSPSTNTTITFNKTLNQIQLTFNSESDYLHYKNDLINTVLSSNPNFSTSKICINQNVDFYQVFSIKLPFQSPNVDCGDNTTTLHYFFHVNDYLNITYVENASSNFWSITIPQTQITNCFLNASCNSCWNVVNNFVTGYNIHASNATSFSYVTNRGSKYLSPFNRHYITRSVSGGISGSYCFTTGTQSWIQVPWYNIHTIPFISSSNGWVNLPSLGGPLPCDLTPFSNRSGQYLYAWYGVWQIRFPHMTGSFDYSLSTNDFEVYALSGPANPITGSRPSWSSCPTGSLIYSYIGGVATMHSSSYFWQGNAPTLYIAP